MLLTPPNYEAHSSTVVTLPWFQGSAYDDVYITAECLSRRTGDDQDSNGFRDCPYGLTWSGAIGDDYIFDSNGDVAGHANVVIEILPAGQRNDDNQGHRHPWAGSDALAGLLLPMQGSTGAVGRSRHRSGQRNQPNCPLPPLLRRPGIGLSTSFR